MAEQEYESLLRSAPMSKVSLYIPLEVAHATVSKLAELKRFQVVDLCADVNPFQRTFVGEIRRMDELERRLNYITDQIEAHQISCKPFAESKHLIQGRPAQQLVDELEQRLNESDERVRQMTESYDTLLARYSDLQEARHVLRETASFFSQHDPSAVPQSDIRPTVEDDTVPLLESALEAASLGNDNGTGGFELEFVAGTIDRARMATFERVLWRVLRGNLYMNWAEIQEPLATPGKQEGGVHKAVFIIFAHGSELLDKIRRISESLGATLYPIDASADKRNAALREVNSRLEDLSSVLNNTSNTLRTELVRISDSISAWWGLVRQEKIVYHTLNCFAFDSGRRSLVAEGWIPTRDIGAVQVALRQATEEAGTSIPPILHEMRGAKDPPTFHRTNKFTEGFQAIIDAYGMASYQEVNPGLFATITFPFLFAVMFGDVGHGFLMTLSALAFIMIEKKYPRGFGEEITDTFFFGRYIILLMGIFAMYTGFIYNDIFSLNFNLFKSGWSFPEPDPSNPGVVSAAISTGRTYLMGLDPAWHGADNALIFTNSLKMKMSIILGVIHMTFAICLQVPNHLHFKNKRFIIADWLPQILFMESLFGYLMFMIVYKWSIDWTKSPIPPPNLLNTLIFMVLSPGSVDEEHQNKLYNGQAFIQVLLLLVAFVCVPWMLCAKPYLLWKDHQAIIKQGYNTIGANGRDDEDVEDAANGHGGEDSGGHGGHGDHFDMGEIVIHQVIHTIEFCLGCISNTASYLRLWALSLAHAQLSEVLWEMTIKRTFGMTGLFGVFAVTFGFTFWFILTIGILCVMEGLSAFLHALRLHWVESNSKHYEGAGKAFAPVSFDGVDEGY